MDKHDVIGYILLSVIALCTVVVGTWVCNVSLVFAHIYVAITQLIPSLYIPHPIAAILQSIDTHAPTIKPRLLQTVLAYALASQFMTYIATWNTPVLLGGAALASMGVARHKSVHPYIMHYGVQALQAMNPYVDMLHAALPNHTVSQSIVTWYQNAVAEIKEE